MDDSFLVVFVIILCSVLIQSIESKSHGRFNSKDGGKIVGGYPVTIRHHPYQVKLQLPQGDEIFNCGGSIISARKSMAYVRAGSTYSDSGGIVYASTRLVAHPLYNAGILDYDVAIIDLRGNMNLDGKTRKVIRLPSPGATVQPGTNVIVTGWGHTRENGTLSTRLMAVTVPTISNAECSKLYSKNNASRSITSRKFCARDPQWGKDACQGDSGGPAVDKSTGVQLGVVSGGYGCARSGFPGIYTDLSNIEIRTWIKNLTGI